jgi:hypothetical protein
MHFSHQMIFWECLERFGSEQSPRSLPPSTGPPEFDTSGARLFKLLVRDAQDGSTSTSRKNNTGQISLSPPGPNRPRFYKLWGDFRDAYSQCAMTKEGDCLVALSGIAQRVEKIMNEQLVAGIWRSNVLEEICWIGYRPNNAVPPSGSLKPAVWRAPTWSWASSSLALMRTRLAMRPEEFKVKYQAEVMDCFVDAKPSGGLNNASLLIRGKLLTLKVSNLRRFGASHTFPAQLEGRQALLPVHLDEPATVFSGNATRRAWLLILRHAIWSPVRPTLRLYAEGLVIVRCSGRTSGFERIGMLEQMDTGTGTTLREVLKQHDEAEDETIELF